VDDDDDDDTSGLTVIFDDNPCKLVPVSILNFIVTKDDGGDDKNRSYIRHAKLQSNRHHQQTNTQHLRRI